MYVCMPANNNLLGKAPEATKLNHATKLPGHECTNSIAFGQKIYPCLAKHFHSRLRRGQVLFDAEPHCFGSLRQLLLIAGLSPEVRHRVNGDVGGACFLAGSPKDFVSFRCRLTRPHIL